MPYADLVSRRKVQRESQRRRRARLRGDPPALVPATGESQPHVNPRPGAPGLTVEGLASILAEELEAVQCRPVGESERARLVAMLVRVALQIVELSDLAVRVRILEETVLEATCAQKSNGWNVS